MYAQVLSLLCPFPSVQLPVVPEENDCVDGLIPSSDSRMGGTENVKNSGRWHSRLKAHVDTVKIMDNLLDYATHLSHFSQPVEGSSAIFVAADGDLYVPRKDDIASAWPSVFNACMHPQ